MKALYDWAIRLYGVAIHAAALAGNSKAKAWVKGRSDWQRKMTERMGTRTSSVWFHCASLGEFEQGRPLIEAYRKLHPHEFLVLTFFSPSGFEVRKDYTGVDAVFYLPLDSYSNACRFLDIVQPKKVFFIKYEYWFNVLRDCHKRSIPVYLISSIFRENQWFFRPWAKSFLQELKRVSRFFVQDPDSEKWLKQHGITQVTVSGDTRFDRVIATAAAKTIHESIATWAAERSIIVAGSTWGADEEILLSAMSRFHRTHSLILVPHEVTPEHLKELAGKLDQLGLTKETVFYSSIDGVIPEKFRILVIDRIGLLSSLYRYGKIAYIGGGFGAGIHNTLEAAVYGIPVVFGPKYEAFREAKELLAFGAAFSVRNQAEWESVSSMLLNEDSVARSSGEAAQRYVLENQGATQRILDCI